LAPSIVIPTTLLNVMTRTLLVIDDNQSVRESLRFLLMRRGYHVLEAEDGAKGVALAAQQPIDGAFVDVNMSGMNGIAVCRELHAQAAAAGRKIAVWMMTGARTNEIEKASVEAGALLLLQKPFDIPDLLQRVETEIGLPVPPASPPASSVDEL
jgi:DNA-binding response OmpR family regulator